MPVLQTTASGVQMATGEYVGNSALNGEHTQDIIVGFKPKYVIVFTGFPGGSARGEKTNYDGAYTLYTDIANEVQSYETGDITTLNDNGFTVSNEGLFGALFNYLNTVYHWVAWG